jgi:hypothetical protein
LNSRDTFRALGMPPTEFLSITASSSVWSQANDKPHLAVCIKLVTPIMAKIHPLTHQLAFDGVFQPLRDAMLDIRDIGLARERTP